MTLAQALYGHTWSCKHSGAREMGGCSLMQWDEIMFKLGQCAKTNHLIYQTIYEIFYVAEVWFVTEQHVFLFVVAQRHIFSYHFEKALNFIEIIG